MTSRVITEGNSSVNFPTQSVKNIVLRTVSGTRVSIRPQGSHCDGLALFYEELTARITELAQHGCRRASRGSMWCQRDLARSSISSEAIRGCPAVDPDVVVPLPLVLARSVDAHAW
jgi:hypothetical protein